MRNGDPSVRRRLANGDYDKWIEDHKRFVGGECLIWPYWRDKNGYGPSRLMCVAAHGEPPASNGQAAHSCGKGHEGCVNPQHLRWATRAENQTEMIDHGNSQRGEVNYNAKLNVDDVRAIRALVGIEKQSSIAKRFGVDQSTVSDIQRRKRWGWLE